MSSFKCLAANVNALITFSILYQRGVYPADDFHLVKKYGQVVMLTQDLAVENYLDKCVSIAFRLDVT